MISSTATRWRRRGYALLSLALAAGAGLAAPTPAGAAPAKAAKASVEAAVRADLNGDNKATFWVHLKGSADLGGAKNVAKKADKSAYVYSTKTAFAEQSQAKLRAWLRDKGADFTPYWITNVVRVTGDSALVDEIAARDDVAKVAAPKTYQLIEPVASSAGGPGTQAVEWGVERINAPQVWAQGVRGEGIVVANIDTGVDLNHPALVNQYRGKKADGTFDHNYNWSPFPGACATPAPCDPHSHGTHTMGTMVGNDGGANQIGVAPGAKWIAAPGCPNGSCSDAALLGAGQWMVAPLDLNGQNPRPDLAPHIVNNSWGTTTGAYDDFYVDIVNSWVAAGIVPVFSNGNNGAGCNTAGSPAEYPNSYAVGAFNSAGAISTFSSRGVGEGGLIKPDIAAPGENVRSSIPGGGYGSKSGTSMAAPHVVGAIALVWSGAPTLERDVAATTALFNQTAIDVNDTTCGGTATRNNVWGDGKLDALAAYNQAPRGPTGTLNGRVLSGGNPVAGAVVTAAGPITRTTTSGADGAYSFPTLSTGNYTLTSAKFGYANGTGTATVVENQTVTVDLTMVAAPRHTVRGTVRDDGGSPVAGAKVTFLGTPIAPVTADASGSYVVTDVPAGSYQLKTDGSRCLATKTDDVTVSGDLTHDVVLASRADAFGYICRSAGIGWVDANTVLPITGDDAAAEVTLPFPVPFYGKTYGKAWVSSNGTLNFLGSNTAYANTAIPAAAAPNAALYPFWDDLKIDANSSVRTEVVGTAPNRSFVVEWRNATYSGADIPRVTLELVIGENGWITYQYKDLSADPRSHGNSATIGVENETGTVALQYSYNEAVLEPGSALRFRVPNTAVLSGTVTDANDKLPVAGAAVAAGSRSVTTDAAGKYAVLVPSGGTKVEVTATNYVLDLRDVVLEDGAVGTHNVALKTGRATADALTVTVPTGQSRTRTIDVRNTGTAPVTWSLTKSSESPWLTVPAASGTLEPGASTKVTVALSAAGAAAGYYDATLKLESNSGRAPVASVGVRLVVPAYVVGLPFQIAQSPGVERAAHSRRVSITPLRHADHAAQVVRSGAERLVAAVVPGGVDFSAGAPAAAPAAIPMYRHPADRNAAAVSVQAGRMIDVNA